MVTALALFAVSLDNLVVTMACLSSVAISASLADLEWTVNAYTLTFAALLLFTAWAWRACLRLRHAVVVPPDSAGDGSALSLSELASAYDEEDPRGTKSDRRRHGRALKEGRLTRADARNPEPGPLRSGRTKGRPRRPLGRT